MKTSLTPTSKPMVGIFSPEIRPWLVVNGWPEAVPDSASAATTVAAMASDLPRIHTSYSDCPRRLPAPNAQEATSCEIEPSPPVGHVLIRNEAQVANATRRCPLSMDSAAPVWDARSRVALNRPARLDALRAS